MNMSKWFKFKPTKELLFVLLSWVIVVAVFYLAFIVITTQNVALNFITFGVVGIMIFGVLVPVVWNTLVMKRPISALGIKKDKLAVSVILCIVLSVIQYFFTLNSIKIPSLTELIPLIAMAVAVGLYENIFYRGWVQLRMEESFGIIPGILLSAVIYTLYHIGYGMDINEMLTLLIVGLVYSSIFRLTSNIFILFPFLTPAGAIFTQIQDGLTLPFPATYGFVIVLVVSIISIIIINKRAKSKKMESRVPIGPNPVK